MCPDMLRQGSRSRILRNRVALVLTGAGWLIAAPALAQEEAARDLPTIVVIGKAEADIARHARRILRFRDGALIADEPVAAPLDARA